MPLHSKFVDLKKPGEIPFVYVAGRTVACDDFVLAGGITATYLKINGYCGVLLAGPIRDMEELHSVGLPIWYESKGVMDSQGCMKVSERGRGCTVNGIRVNQGDIITGDVNGVIAIDPSDIDRLVEAAESISERESFILKEIGKGVNLNELIKKGGHI